MASSLVLVALALFAVAASADQSRIIGGNVVSIQTYPSVVQVESLLQQVNWLHLCGGVVINAIHVLSAAHCFPANAVDNRRMRAGTNALESGGVIVHIGQVFPHPTYGLNGNDGDIAVVRLSSAFIFNQNLAAAQIVASGAVLPAGMLVTKAGWGSISVTSNDRSPYLQVTNVPVVSHTICAASYAGLTSSPPVTSNMFCAGSVLTDACYGDGGGPVFFGNVVVGIMSWGNGCLIAGFPGVNTAVSVYTNWIVATVSS